MNNAAEWSVFLTILVCCAIIGAVLLGWIGFIFGAVVGCLVGLVIAAVMAWIESRENERRWK